MIEKNEVLKMATELDLRPDTIEKDYVLGWMLWGIHQHPVISSWAFKGGTSLKKCHLETFRFSEDLDFTLTNPLHLTKEFLTQAFIEVTDLLSEETGKWSNLFINSFTRPSYDSPSNCFTQRLNCIQMWNKIPRRPKNGLCRDDKLR